MLKALESIYRANRDAVEGLADRNGHRQKVVGDDLRIVADMFKYIFRICLVIWYCHVDINSSL